MELPAWPRHRLVTRSWQRDGVRRGRPEFSLLQRDKHRVDVLLCAMTQRNVRGQINGAVGVSQDLARFREAGSEPTSIAGDLSLLTGAVNAPTFGAEVDCKVME